MAKSPEELLKERTKRIEDAVNLKVPDRVPHVPYFGYFTARYAGITPGEAYYNAEKWKQACRKTIVDFAPDMYTLTVIIPGKVLEALDCKQLNWPGYNAPPDHSQQYRDAEYMKASEYDVLLRDPSDFAIRNYVPRVYGALSVFSQLPPPWQLILGYGESMLTEVLAGPEFTRAIESLLTAGKEAQKWNDVMRTLPDEMVALGFPTFYMAKTTAPYDLIQDYLRGMRGAMLDMYKQPDKLLEACEKLLPMMIEVGVTGARMTGNPRVFIPLHWGSEGFMSIKQFETFYWPTFKKLVHALADEGLTPFPFFEGNYTSRLEYLLEFPKGKVVGRFDTTDLFKAKEVIGKHMCIMGNFPTSLLQVGSPQEIKDYCKKLIDVVGKDGGYIMCTRAPMDEAKPESVRVMFDFVREYGVYR